MANKDQDITTDIDTKYKWLPVITFNAALLIMLSFYVGAFAVIFMILSLVSGVKSVKLANSNNKNKFLIGYGLPAILLLPTAFFINDVLTCVGKWCGMYSFIFAFALGIFSVNFIIFFTISYYASKIKRRRLLLVLSSIVLPILTFNIFFVLN